MTNLQQNPIDSRFDDPRGVTYYRVSVKGDDGDFLVNRRAETKAEAYDLAYQVTEVFGYKPVITGFWKAGGRHEAWRVN